MARDPSYAEYVDARWFVLYRLAALLVGEERAGTVAEEALVRAHLHWHEVLEAASPDEYVEGLLARTAVEHARSERSDGTGLDALPARQRAVVVLQSFELLDDAAVARALGVEVADVAADGAAALAGAGVTEPELVEELGRRVESIAVPPAPLDDLVARVHDQRSRRRRRRLAWAALIALAAVVATAEAAAVQGLWGRGQHTATPSMPASLSRLPAGPPPRVAYVEGLTVSLPGGPLIVRHPPTDLLQAGPWVYLGFPSGEVDRVDSRSLARTTVTQQSTGRVVADPSGRQVAWVRSGADAGRPVVVVRALGSRGDTVGQQQRAFPAGPDPFVLVGLDRNGDVYASRPAERDGVWVWRTGLVPAPGHRVLDRISGVGNGTLVQVASGDLVVEIGGAFAAGTLHGTNLVYDQEVPGALADFTDPTGRRVVQVDDTTSDQGAGPQGVWVLERTHDLDPRHPRRRLRVAADVEIADVRWEDSRHVLVDAADASMPRGALVRCDVVSAACELAARFEGPHLLAR